MKYYVYAYLDSKLEENISFDDITFTLRPIYIGKGKNNRMLDHFKDRKRFNTYFYNKLNKMILEENTPMVIKLKEFDNEPDGYNIGMNCGEPAGQTVMQFHCHLIPRYTGDVENPRGGVRHSVMGKGYY